MQLQAMLLTVILFTNMTTLCKTQTPFSIITSPILNIFLSHLRLMVAYWPTKLKSPSLLITKLWRFLCSRLNLVVRFEIEASNPWSTCPGTYWIGEKLDTRVGLDVTEKKQIPACVWRRTKAPIQSGTKIKFVRQLTV